MTFFIYFYILLRVVVLLIVLFPSFVVFSINTFEFINMILSLIHSKKDILGVFILFILLTLYFLMNYYYKLFNFYDKKKSVIFKICISLLSLAFLYLGLETDIINIDK